MASELRDRLQTALGTAYSLQRELGGGGMSRVFLARDAALNRDIVVKVLHPELAGAVNVDRFKREIQLAAQLQHPHIVPLLAAGELDGLPYLTMPYVAGRSLRERLSETPMLPIGEAVDILRDVARALAFAHGRGVIHRDIKPDNVLLAEGSATVTDFGVAKAINAARGGVDRPEGDSPKDLPDAALTSVGISLGTPTYMAPEQAAGDPSTDHRADIYAWGVMAFEMLAGRPPFTASSPHKLLAAHMTEAPGPLTDYRPDCPPPLAALVMHCLEKDPDARPQSAADVVRGLTEAAMPSGANHESLPAIGLSTRQTLGRALGLYAAAFIVVVALAQTAVTMIGLPEWVLPGALAVMALGLPVVLFTALNVSPYLTWRRTALGGAAAVTAFATLVVGFMVLRALGIGPSGSLLAKGVIRDRDQILVGEFTAPATDSGLGAVVSEAVRMGLAESGAVKVMQPTQVADALSRMQRPPTSHVDRALAQEVAQREGAKAIVDGDVTPLGAGFIVTVRLRGTDPPDELASYRETAASATDLVPAIDRATRKLRGKIGESLKAVRATVPLQRATTTSLPALRKYTQGFLKNALDRDYTAAIPLLEDAIALDTNFALAYRQAALVYANAGLRRGRADTLREKAYELRDRLPDLERALVEATYYDTGTPRYDRAKAIAADERALAIDPTSSSALNGLAILLASRRDYARAESLYKTGQQTHPEVSFFWSNALSTYVAQGKLDAAQQAVDEYRRRFPRNPNAVFVGALVWAARGQTDSVAAECQRSAQVADLQTRVSGLGCLATLALQGGKLRESNRILAQARALSAARGVVFNAADVAAFDSAYQDIWFLERVPEGLQRVDVLAARQTPSLTNVALYSLAGRGDKARALLVRYDSSVGRDTSRVRRERDVHHRALGAIAVAERKYDVAIRELWAADTLYDGAPTACSACTLAELARAYDLAGKPDSAIAYFEQYVTSRYAYRGRDLDAQYLAGSYKRLGELYEAKGDRDKAASYYSRFIEMWKDADPELQPRVAEVRRRLVSLTSDRRR